MSIEVLLVDDDIDLLEIASMYLQKDNELMVTSVSSVSKALEILNHQSFDLIVSDYQMPQTNGLEFLELLRDEGNKIPFIIFTGRSREEVAIRALNLGATFYVTKGGHPKSQYAELVHMIKSAVHYHRINDEFQKSEERYRHLLQSTFDGTLIHSHGQILQISQSLIDIFGFNLDIIGSHISDFVQSEDDELDRLIESSSETRKELSLCMQGRNVIIEIVSQPTTFKNKPASIWAIRDVSHERKISTEYEREKIAFQIIAEAATEHLSLEVVCSKVLIGLAELLNFQYGIIGLIKHNSDILELVAYHGPNLDEVDIKPHSINDSQRLAAYVARTGNTIFAPDVSKHPVHETHKYRIEIMNIKSLISWPLYRENESVWGVVQLWSTEKLELLSDDYIFFETVAKMFQSVISQKEAQKAKASSEQKYKEVIQHTRQPIVIIQDRKIVFTNQAFSDLIEYSIEELYSLPREDLLVHPDDRKEVLYRDSERLKGRVFKIPLSFRLLSKNGDVVWVESLASVVDYEGASAIQVAYFDITARRKAEEALKRERLAIRVIAEASLIAESTEHLSDMVVSGLSKLLEFDFASFRLFNSTNNILELKATYGVQNDLLLGSKHIDDESSIQSYAARESEAVYANSIYEHELCKPNIERFELFGITSYVSLPVLKGDKSLVGVISFGSRIPREFDDRDKIFFENLVKMYASAINRQETETALQESEKKYRELVEYSLIGFCIIQDDGYVFANQAFADITGYSIPELLEMSYEYVITQHTHPDDIKKLEARFRRRILGEEISPYTKFRYIRPSGETRWVEGFSTAIMFNDVPAVQLQVLDITDKILSEQLLRKQKEELSEFAHQMSHDMKTYFHNILGYSNLLEEEYNREHLTAIQRSVRALENLLLRSVELADSGLIIGTMTEVDLRKIVSKAAEEIIPADITFKLVDLPIVECDSQKIDQVVRNLLKNAVEHAEPNLIEVKTKRNGNNLLISFCNDGIPIPQEYRGKLFTEKFSTKKDGGMGLRIVHRIVDAHGWDIHLDEAETTCFTITIPNEFVVAKD
ncbi:MAG: PAS domain S-box protein [Candidatus Lokiarchaeota archaeon]|nr:PAS domain S-box protein [Candidatus Lokiarchaeota archaeon]